MTLNDWTLINHNIIKSKSKNKSRVVNGKHAKGKGTNFVFMPIINSQ